MAEEPSRIGVGQDQPVAVGVAGLGRAGWDIHVKALLGLAGQYRVVAVMDNLPDRRAEAAATLKCATYETFEELLADREVELLVVALPTQFHADCVVAALQAGKHVVCEKPMARDLAECDRMIAAERASGRVLTVFQNRRYSPTFLKVRQVLASGVLGRINLVRVAWCDFRRRWDWQTVRALGGGMLHNYGAHRIDQLMEFSGPTEPEVYCRLDRVLTSGDAEDFVRLSLSAPDAPLLELDVFMNCAYDLPEWLVLGDRGTLIGGGSGRPIQWKVVKGFESLPARPVDLAPVADRSYKQEKLEFDEFSAVAEDEFESGETAFYRALYPALRGGALVPITTASIHRRMLVIEKAAKEQERLR